MRVLKIVQDNQNYADYLIVLLLLIFTDIGVSWRSKSVLAKTGLKGLGLVKQHNFDASFCGSERHDFC